MQLLLCKNFQLNNNTSWLHTYNQLSTIYIICIEFMFSVLIINAYFNPIYGYNDFKLNLAFITGRLEVFTRLKLPIS